MGLSPHVTILQAEKPRPREVVGRLEPKLSHRSEDDGGENTGNRCHQLGRSQLPSQELVPTLIYLFA